MTHLDSFGRPDEPDSAGLNVLELDDARARARANSQIYPWNVVRETSLSLRPIIANFPAVITNSTAFFFFSPAVHSLDAAIRPPTIRSLHRSTAECPGPEAPFALSTR